MGHSYNHGLVTSAKGAAFEQIRLVATDGAGALAIAQDCGAGLVSTITRNGQGDYTLQLSKPYPPKLITANATVSCATKTTATTQARMKTAGYDATLGQLTFFFSDAAGTAAADPASGQEIHLNIEFRRYTT